MHDVHYAAYCDRRPVAWCTRLPVCLSLCHADPLIGVETLMDPRHIVPDESPDALTARRSVSGERLSILKYINVVVRIRCGLCQITLASC